MLTRHPTFGPFGEIIDAGSVVVLDESSSFVVKEQHPDITTVSPILTSIGPSLRAFSLSPSSSLPERSGVPRRERWQSPSSSGANPFNSSQVEHILSTTGRDIGGGGVNDDGRSPLIPPPMPTTSTPSPSKSGTAASKSFCLATTESVSTISSM
uniref:Uncharacterized protein n=1 Tax=Opuntia streptacantha TaxID=393608 RepID=A0A7C8YKS5_OPUST